MPRRAVVRATTQEAIIAALDEALTLLGGGPNAVNLQALLPRIPYDRDWVFKYIGNRREILQAAIDLESLRLIGRLNQLATVPLPPSQRVRAVLGDLLPVEGFHTRLWVIHLLPLHAPTRAAAMEDALAFALQPEVGPYEDWIGGGILGALGSAARRIRTPDRDLFLRRITEMTQSVLLFHRATTRRDMGAN